jgi:predicted HTH domain antitoxin
MKTIHLEIPDTLELDVREAAMILATSLYERGKVTLGQAAELAGLDKRTFCQILGNYEVSVFNYPSSDLAIDVRNA